jgi:hypothetical protein
MKGREVVRVFQMVGRWRREGSARTEVTGEKEMREEIGVIPRRGRGRGRGGERKSRWRLVANVLGKFWARAGVDRQTDHDYGGGVIHEASRRHYS